VKELSVGKSLRMLKSITSKDLEAFSNWFFEAE